MIHGPCLPRACAVEGGRQAACCRWCVALMQREALLRAAPSQPSVPAATLPLQVVFRVKPHTKVRRQHRNAAWCTSHVLAGQRNRTTSAAG